ncbi:hypothetical protein HPB49_025031 [Dermacentor silvarum]|uniref:Uncharacterized protein n=1 Tax=Dermacentor silvarum TaxID=543639 RepID=A0ACB8C6A2_DERSI|nr:hypothetical protein HPB49_025031 [Dermacentor silvarum]
MAAGNSPDDAGPSSDHQLTPSMVNLPDEDSDMDSREYSSQDPGLLTSSSDPAASSPSHGPAWEYSLSKHRAKKLRRAAREAQISSSLGAANSVSGTPSNVNVPSPDITRKPGPRRPRLPPLPKGDLKVVIRPTRGLALKQYPDHAISAAIVMSCQTPARVEGKYVVRPHKGSNILIVSTPHEETADEICQLTHLKLANQAHPVRAYVPFSPQTIRGVIHGLDPNNTRETLMKGLWVRDTRIKILDARILGTSTTALLTIDGPHLPRLVYHGGCEYPCHQFTLARQFCQMCMQSGHRPDVCPNPNTPVCRQCGMQNPPPTHVCEPKCGLCGGQHETGTKECPKRLKPARMLQPPPARNNAEKRPSRLDGLPKIYNNRWFYSEDSDSASRSQSRSWSGSGTRARQQQAEPPQIRTPPTPMPRKKKQQQPAQDTTKQVSWEGKGKDSPAPQTDPRIPKLQAIIKAQNAKIAEQDAKLTALMAKLEQVIKHNTAPPPATPPQQPNEVVTHQTLQRTLQDMQKTLVSSLIENVTQLFSALQAKIENIAANLTQVTATQNQHSNSIQALQTQRRKRASSCEQGPSRNRSRANSIGSDSSPPAHLVTQYGPKP